MRNRDQAPRHLRGAHDSSLISPEAVHNDTENGVATAYFFGAFTDRIATEARRGSEFLDLGEWVNVEDNLAALYRLRQQACDGLKSAQNTRHNAVRDADKPSRLTTGDST